MHPSSIHFPLKQFHSVNRCIPHTRYLLLPAFLPLHLFASFATSPSGGESRQQVADFPRAGALGPVDHSRVPTPHGRAEPPPPQLLSRPHAAISDGRRKQPRAWQRQRSALAVAGMRRRQRHLCVHDGRRVLPCDRGRVKEMKTSVIVIPGSHDELFLVDVNFRSRVV